MSKTTLSENMLPSVYPNELQGMQPTMAPLSVRDLAVAYHKSQSSAGFPLIYRKDSSSAFSVQTGPGSLL